MLFYKLNTFFNKGVCEFSVILGLSTFSITGIDATPKN